MNATLEISTQLLQTMEEILNIDPSQVKMEDRFSDDLGIDSLDVMVLITAIEKEFKINIDEDDTSKLTTVGSLIDYVNGKLIQQPLPVMHEREKI